MNKFKPGISGNPAGRPKGAIGILTKKRRLLSEYMPVIVEATQEVANIGDVETLTNCLALLKKAIERKL